VRNTSEISVGFCIRSSVSIGDKGNLLKEREADVLSAIQIFRGYFPYCRWAARMMLEAGFEP
jgi:hypothetical protein